MIFQGYDLNTFKQDYLETLLGEVFPSYKVNNIVPWHFVYKAGQGFSFNQNNLYFGDLFCQSGASAKLNGVDFPLPVVGSSLRCLFNDLGDTTEVYQFSGFKISFDNSILQLFDVPANTSTGSGGAPPPGSPVVVLPAAPNAPLSDDVIIFYEVVSQKLVIRVNNSVDGSLFRLAIFFDGSNSPALYASIAEISEGKLFTAVNNFSMIKLSFVLISNENVRSDYYVLQSNLYDVKPFSVSLSNTTLRVDLMSDDAEFIDVAVNGSDSDLLLASGDHRWTFGPVSPPATVSTTVSQRGYQCPFVFNETFN